MKCSVWTGITLTGGALMAALLLLSSPLRAAEENADPKPSVKALIEEALRDWKDPAERQAVIRELHDLFSARLADLQGLAERHWAEAREAARHVVHQAGELVDLKRDEPREYERRCRILRLEDECTALAQKARAAQGAQHEQLVAELKKKLADLFDARQEMMERDLAAMEAEVESLRRRVSKRAENRGQLIERRALDLLSDVEAEW